MKKMLAFLIINKKMPFNQCILKKVEGKIKLGWKWGHLFRALAQNGVWVDVSGPEKNHGIVLSLDGVHWCRATKVAGDGWKIPELQKRLGAAEFRPPRKNIAEIAAAVRAKHPLGKLNLDEDVELTDDLSDIGNEPIPEETPTNTFAKPMPTEMEKLQDISPTPLVHRPFRTNFEPNSRAVLSRRSTDPTPERQKFSETLAQRITKYSENAPVAPAPVIETMDTPQAKKRPASTPNSVPVRRKSFLPPATFRFRSLRNLRPSRRISAWAASRSWVVLYRERMNYRNRIAMARAWAARNNETGSTRKPEGPATETAAIYQ